MKRLLAAAATLAGSLGAGTAMADEPSCAPTVTVEGDPALAEAVRAELALPASELPPCPPLVVRVESSAEGGLRVSLVDVTGRGASEVLSDAKMAALWIRSWLGDDYADPLMFEEPPPAPPVAPLGPRAPVRILVRAAIGLAQSDDTSRWSVARLGGCVQLGPTCLGLALRGAVQAPSEIRAGAIASFERRDLSVSATLAAPFTSAKARVIPELGAGVGWTSTGRRDGEACTPPDPSGTGTGTLPCVDASSHLYFGDGFSSTSATLRLDAGVTLGLILGSGFVLDFNLSGGVMVGGSRGSIVPDQRFVLTHGLASAEIAALPPLPRYAGTVMLGLSWESQ